MAGVSILLVDDEALVRSGLRLLLDGADGLNVVGEAANGVEALAAAERLDPDVILMDVRMPVMGGLEATTTLLQRQPEAKILILTTFDHDATVLESLRIGAVGFLLKDTEPADLIASVHQAARGRMPLSPTITRRLVGAATRTLGDTRRQRAAAALSTLTDRERNIALAVAQGDTNAEIAERLFISLGTVKTHLAAVMMKLGATNRVQVALRCYEADLV